MFSRYTMILSALIFIPINASPLRAGESSNLIISDENQRVVTFQTWQDENRISASVLTVTQYPADGNPATRFQLTADFLRAELVTVSSQNTVLLAGSFRGNLQCGPFSLDSGDQEISFFLAIQEDGHITEPVSLAGRILALRPNSWNEFEAIVHVQETTTQRCLLDSDGIPLDHSELRMEHTIISPLFPQSARPTNPNYVLQPETNYEPPIIILPPSGINPPTAMLATDG